MTRTLLISATATAAAGLSLGMAGVANAAQTSPVPGTHCTVAQIERAVTKVYPGSLALLDQVPGGRANAERILALDPKARHAQVHKILQQNPKLASLLKANKTELVSFMHQVSATCARA